ncbi:LysE/ArgO family amino acid transporter [Brasilonema sp. UFV-L1]|uniref:LysE family transporter n=1 Tax=Brasilonema sp. UFV-L1 TaxID=2234130 RepID=UPI0016BAC6A1|nr:amino acid transporter [Brasilonema sp. UFV-L1]
MSESWLVLLLKGFTLFAGLIVAIGAQNAFVLRQGLKRQYVFVTASICFLCDFILITIGTIGFGTLSSKVPGLTQAAAWAGAVFLLFYGLRSFKSALAPLVIDIDKVDTQSKSFRSTVVTTLALSLLNPHAHLDTLVVVGSMATQYSLSQRFFFALGASGASLTWFFGLGYGAAWLTPLFQRPSAWRILDTIIGCIMWSIAVSLIFAALNNSL